MNDISRQRRPETMAWQSVMVAAMMHIGTSVALAKAPQTPVVQSDYGFESAVSPDAQHLEREVVWLLGHLRSHSALGDAPETIEAPVNRAHISCATAAASSLPDMAISDDDFAVVMATRTRFPRSFDADDDQE